MIKILPEKKNMWDIYLQYVFLVCIDLFIKYINVYKVSLLIVILLRTSENTHTIQIL